MSFLSRRVVSHTVRLSAVLCAILLCSAAPTPAADQSGWILPASMGAGWSVRVKDARAEAAKAGKQILVLFSGPDWSSASKKLESSVFRSKEFLSMIDGKMVRLYIQHFVNSAAPSAQNAQNTAFRRAMNPPNVYPCTMVLASDGKTILGTISGAPDKKSFLKKLAKITGLEEPES